MIVVTTLDARRHEPPRGWDARTFDVVTDALAQMLVSAYKRSTLDDEQHARINDARREHDVQ